VSRREATIDAAMVREQAAWSSDQSLHFYVTHRCTPEELYESERFFLPQVLGKVASVLDVGCAAGGFSAVMKRFNPHLRYVGVDIIPDFIELARRRYPEAEFHVADGVSMPFAAESFELVHSSGTLHLNSRYRDMVRTAWDCSSHFLLCDFRLTRGPSVVGSMAVDFGGPGAVPTHVLPYHVVNVDELLAFLRELRPGPVRIQGRGYSRPPAPSARIPLDKVYMAFFLVEKGRSARPPTVELTLDE